VIKSAEAKIREAEEYRKLMLDAVPLYCTLWDENYNIIDCDSETLRLFDLENYHEFQSRFFQFAPKRQPDGKSSIRKIIEMFQTALEGERCVFEWTHRMPCGESVPYEITLIRVISNGHRVIAGFGKDMRELKAAEAKIKDANERMNVMFDAMPFGCSFWDNNVNIIDCNNEILKLFDIENKQSFVENFFELSPKYQPDGRLSQEKALWLVKHALDYGRAVCEWVHQKLNGDLIPSEVTLVNAKHHTGHIVIAYIHDLRKLKDISAKLNIAENLAFSDQLTGLHNRRYFMQFASQKFNIRDNLSFYIGIIMFDIDYFKRVNDTYGHGVGDEALKLISVAVQSVLRETDIFARYGGEEFIILIQHLNLDDLTKLAWRICKKVEKVEFFCDNIKIPITISAGVAIRKDADSTIDETIKYADLALYKAKANGRNRVEVYAE